MQIWPILAQFDTCFWMLSIMSSQDRLNIALKQARNFEAAQFDALLSMADARLLRLQNLNDALAISFKKNPKLLELFELKMQQGVKPKLWLDLASAVVMEPDPRNFRLIQDSEFGRENLFETSDIKQMENYVVRYLGQRQVQREKALVAAPATAPSHYTIRDMIYIWLTGSVFGAMIMLMIAIYLERIHF
jgi:hypothetical protein